MKFQRKTGLHEATLVDDQTVLLDISTSRYYDLNPVAARIWHLLEEPRNLDEICRLLEAEFDVDDRQCRQQVQGFLEDMLDKGLCDAADA